MYLSITRAIPTVLYIPYNVVNYNASIKRTSIRKIKHVCVIMDYLSIMVMNNPLGG